MSTEKNNQRCDDLSYITDPHDRAAKRAEKEAKTLREALELIRGLVTSGDAPDAEIDKKLTEAWSKAK